jgi:hypothetical protein
VFHFHIVMLIFVMLRIVKLSVFVLSVSFSGWYADFRYAETKMFMTVASLRLYETEICLHVNLD